MSTTIAPGAAVGSGAAPAREQATAASASRAGRAPGIGASPRQPRHCHVRGDEADAALDRAGQFLSAHLASAERVTA